MCTIAGAKVQLNYNCYNVYLNECLRIDEVEAEIERGEGKSFQEMMEGFKKELLWLK